MDALPSAVLFWKLLLNSIETSLLNIISIGGD